MIVCHCNVITCGELRKAAAELCDTDPYAIVTPGTLFRACGARPQCGCCMPRVADLIVEVLDEFELAG
jgi:bacterioferritin-associated ferredoxin